MDDYRKQCPLDTTDQLHTCTHKAAIAFTRPVQAQSRPKLCTERGAGHDMPPLATELLAVVSPERVFS